MCLCQVLVLMTKRKDPSPSTLHYNAVLHAFARQGRMDDALLVFADMKDRRVRLIDVCMASHSFEPYARSSC
jgi:pentatricopeptide repeat protein